MILNLYHYGFIFSENQPSIYQELMLLVQAELQRAYRRAGKCGVNICCVAEGNKTRRRETNNSTSVTAFLLIFFFSLSLVLLYAVYICAPSRNELMQPLSDVKTFPEHRPQHIQNMRVTAGIYFRGIQIHQPSASEDVTYATPHQQVAVYNLMVQQKLRSAAHSSRQLSQILYIQQLSCCYIISVTSPSVIGYTHDRGICDSDWVLHLQRCLLNRNFMQLDTEFNSLTLRCSLPFTDSLFLLKAQNHYQYFWFSFDVLGCRCFTL